VTTNSKLPLRSLVCLALTASFGLMTAGSCLATPITFAQFISTNGAQTWSITETTSGGITTTSVTESGDAYFSYQGINAQPFSGLPQLARFTLTATSTSLGNCAVSCGPGDGFTQAGYAGSFTFTDEAAGAYLGANLLSGIFSVTGSPSTTGAQLTSNIGSGNASFTASATAGNLNQLVLNSAFETFSPSTTDEVASFSLSSLTPNFGVTTTVGNQAYPNGSFTAAGSGTFSSNPAPLVTATPEPSTFLLIGGGLLAVGLKTRRKLVRAQ
jgi:hypothetical protein